MSSPTTNLQLSLPPRVARMVCDELANIIDRQARAAASNELLAETHPDSPFLAIIPWGPRSAERDAEVLADMRVHSNVWAAIRQTDQESDADLYARWCSAVDCARQAIKEAEQRVYEAAQDIERCREARDAAATEEDIVRTRNDLDTACNRHTRLLCDLLLAEGAK